MSYLPGLRTALVDAARQRYGDAPEPRTRQSRRRWLTGAATGLAAAVAVAVALLAVVVLGRHRTSAPRTASPGVSRVDLRRSAEEALSQLRLPRGAVLSGLARGAPAELRSVLDRLRIPGHVDVYRIWRVPESPDRVISFIEREQAASSPPGFQTGVVTGSEASSSGSGHTVVIEQATGVINLPVTGAGIWRELAVDAVRRGDGATALRVDSEAGWLKPRPASERIPVGVARVDFSWTLRGTTKHLSVTLTNPHRIGALVSTFNSLPSARPGTGLCTDARKGIVRFKFEGSGHGAPIAVAVWAPFCQNLGLSIRGGPSVPVRAGNPNMPAGAQLAELLAELTPVTGRRVSSSQTVVNSSHGCTISTSPSSAHSQSAPGAEGGSCASASRSTRSASSP